MSQKAATVKENKKKKTQRERDREGNDKKVGRADTEKNGEDGWTGVWDAENCLSMRGDRYTHMSIADGGDDGDTGTLQVGRGIHFWRRIMSWDR